MAFDTVIDKAQLEAAMKATADAIREKTGDTANCTWDPAQGFAALIAAIEAGGSNGDIVTGTFTPTSETENVILKNAIPVRAKSPILYWICETGVGVSDKTHTKLRTHIVSGKRSTYGESASSNDKYAVVYMYSSSGSSSRSAGTTNVAGLFGGFGLTSDVSITSYYDVFRGNYTNGTIFFGCNGTGYGLIAGRTYQWGVMVWPE